MNFKIEEFKLDEDAKKAGELAKLLERFGKQKEPVNIFEVAEAVLLEVLALSGDERRVQGQNTPEFNKEGIETMFSCMSLNKSMTAAPTEEKERADFYKTLAYGYKFVGDTIKEEYEAGNMDKRDVYSCMDSIGDGSVACASRWRSVLEELLRGFSHRIKLPGYEAENQTDRLKAQIGEQFLKGKVIEVNKAAEEFVKDHYPTLSIENRVHFTTFFKRSVNTLLGYNLPITMEEDSFIRRDKARIFQDVKQYLKDCAMDDRIVKRVVSLVQEDIRTNTTLYNAVVDYAHGEFSKSPILEKKYGDSVTFMEEAVFKGFSKEIKEEAVLEIIKDKGFAKAVVVNFFMDLENELTVLLHRIIDLPSKNLERLFETVPDKLIFDTYIEPFLDRKNYKGQNLLHVCLEHNMKNFPKYLLNYAFDLEAKDKNGFSPLHWAAYRKNQEMVEGLFEKGAKVNEENGQSTSVLYISVSKEDYNTTKFLAERNANLNHKISNGSTVLIRAIERGYNPIAKLLIDSGANIEIADKRNQSPLHWAASQGNEEMLALLIQKGADLNKQDVRGNTALHIAAERGYPNIVKLLVENHADLDLQKNTGSTALMIATEYGRTEIGEYLIEKNANLELTNRLHQTPRQVAVAMKNRTLIQAIQEKTKENIRLNMKQRSRHGEETLAKGFFARRR